MGVNKEYFEEENNKKNWKRKNVDISLKSPVNFYESDTGVLVTMLKIKLFLDKNGTISYPASILKNIKL